jgi:16S rRNA (guanine966-N2)-methyltransferase
MRIISGQYKGRRLNPPKNLPVRPTTDMSKEALFNVLNHRFDFQAIKVLDLFSGTGNISFEFASRGSESITSVDADFGCIKYIKQVTTEFEFPIMTIKSDVFQFLEKATATYDIIFADPPYGLEQAVFEKLVETVLSKQMLNASGLLIVEHSKHTKLSQLNQFLFNKVYGGSVFSFFGIEENLD